MLRTTKLIARKHNLSLDRTHFQFPGHFSSLSFMQFILVVRKRGFLPPDLGSRVSRFWLASVLPLSLSEGSRKPCDPLGIHYPLYSNSEHRAYLDSLYHHVQCRLPQNDTIGKHPTYSSSFVPLFLAP